MQIKLCDNSSKSKEYFSGVQNLVNKIADKSLDVLERDGLFVFSNAIKDTEYLSDDRYILKNINGDFHTGNLMGFIGYRKEYITIDSRFSNMDDDYFLKYMLECVLNFPCTLNLNTTFDKNARILDYFMLLFPRYLKDAMRKGVYKSYVLNEYNDSNVKGIIDIKRHITSNTPFLGRVAYNQREFSYDNYLTQLIRHTIEFIKRKPSSDQLLSGIKDEVSEIISRTTSYKHTNRQEIVSQNKRNPVKHSYFLEYKKLQRLCLLILQQEKCQAGSGISEIYGVIFDGAWLWEEYINSLLTDYFYHPKNKAGEGAQRLFSDNIGLIYPDFISKNSDNRIIADAKYKPIKNIGNKDYLQVLAYMYRFDAKKGLYLYPESNNFNSIKLFLNQGSTFERNVMPREDVSVEKCGFKIPDNADNYSNFRTLMRKNEIDFIGHIKNLFS